MNKSEVVDQMKQIIAGELDANLEAAQIGESDSLFEDGLGLDSVEIVEFITILEERFGFQFEEIDLTQELLQLLFLLNRLTNLLGHSLDFSFLFYRHSPDFIKKS